MKDLIYFKGDVYGYTCIYIYVFQKIIVEYQYIDII